VAIADSLYKYYEYSVGHCLFSEVYLTYKTFQFISGRANKSDIASFVSTGVTTVRTEAGTFRKYSQIELTRLFLK
jgi:hypothetical protein